MEESNAKSRIAGWIKAGVASIVSLVGGAILMYLSPIVNNVIKPAKPVANFAVQSQGMTVTINDRSTGGTDGWWDFGDGSALEPYSPHQGTLTHTYAKANSYNVKLSLSNFIGDPAEPRNVTVDLSGTSAVATAPAIDAFTVQTLQSTSPATFKVLAHVANAEKLIWSNGDNQDMEFVTDTVNGTIEHYVSIPEPGYYTIRLAALAGNQVTQKSISQFVGMSDETHPQAQVKVTYQYVHVTKKQSDYALPTVSFPGNSKENSYAFTVERTAESAGFKILDAKFSDKAPKNDAVKNAKIEIAKDGSKVTVSGTLTKAGGFLQKNVPPPAWVPLITLTEEKRSGTQTKSMPAVTMDVNVPGSTPLPLPAVPAGWEVTGRDITMDLKQGAQTLWHDTKMPNGAVVQVNNRPVRVSGVEVAGGIRLDIADGFAPQAPVLPTGFQKR